MFLNITASPVNPLKSNGSTPITARAVIGSQKIGAMTARAVMGSRAKRINLSQSVQILPRIAARAVMGPRAWLRGQ